MADEYPGGGWTVDTALAHVLALIAKTHEHFTALIAELDARNEQRFIGQKESVKIAMEAADRAVTKAETAAEKRFEGVNEFRAQLADQQRTLMPRQEAEIRFAALADKIAILVNANTAQQARGIGSKEGWGWAVGVAAAVLLMLALVSAVIGFVMRAATP